MNRSFPSREADPVSESGKVLLLCVVCAWPRENMSSAGMRWHFLCAATLGVSLPRRLWYVCACVCPCVRACACECVHVSTKLMHVV